MCQDIEPDVLPRVCGQLNAEVSSHRAAHKWLVPPTERLLLRENPKKEVKELWQQPVVALMQHVPRHRCSDIDGKWSVLPNCWHRRSDRTTSLLVLSAKPATPAEGQCCRDEAEQVQVRSVP